jgi:Ca2+-binding EF-hand superfamily protein
MTVRLLATASAAALALAAAPVPAQILEDWSFQNDATVDRDEYTAYVEEQGVFDVYDADEDSYLGAPEYYVATYDMIDLDGDGTITVSEWDDWADTRIGEEEVNLSVDNWDPNGDDIITRAEYDAATSEAPWFADADLNADSRIDQAEFVDGVFEWWDFNDDAVITEDEVDLEM